MKRATVILALLALAGCNRTLIIHQAAPAAVPVKPKPCCQQYEGPRGLSTGRIA